MNKLILLVLMSSILLTGCVNISPQISLCETKSDLSADEIGMFDDIGKKYINYVNDEDSASLKDELSSFAKTLPSTQNVELLIDNIKEQFGDFSNPQLVDVFRIKTTPNSPIICTDDLSNKKNNYIVAGAQDLSNFVVIIHEVTTESGKVNYINEIVKEEENWKLRAFQFQMKEVNGHSADYFFDLGEEQLDKGNNRNALFLFSIGQQLLLNNALVQIEYINTINEKINSIDFQDIPTTKPEEWTTQSGTTYTIYKIAPQITKEEMGLQIHYVTDDLDNQNQVDTESEEIAIYVKNNFPEYEEIFAGLIITAAEKIPEPTEVVNAYNNVYTFDELE